MKVILRGKFIVASAYLRKTEPGQLNNLMMNLKLVEKQQSKPEPTLRREIIKIVAEINKIETKKKKSMNQRAVL